MILLSCLVAISCQQDSARTRGLTFVLALHLIGYSPCYYAAMDFHFMDVQSEVCSARLVSCLFMSLDLYGNCYTADRLNW
jgi:hypothetical protein